MHLLRIFTFLGGALLACASEPRILVLAAIDFEQVAALGMQVERKRPVHDFTVTYIRNPSTGDELGIYEGGNPTLFSSRGKRLGEVKAVIAGEAATWICWSQENGGQTEYGAEVLIPSRSVFHRNPDHEYQEEFHIFLVRPSLAALRSGRILAESIIRKVPNQAVQPTPGSVTPRASSSTSK
jgi:hypothetical protein